MAPHRATSSATARATGSDAIPSLLTASAAAAGLNLTSCGREMASYGGASPRPPEHRRLV
uniref:Uncharacterized protein n=1 Tax=Arundo donax TaxID=35708 RepID=A0A0A9FUU1_ARUDO